MIKKMPMTPGPSLSLELIFRPFARGNRWLLFFLLAAMIQVTHNLEHVLQVTQIHILGVPAPRAQGLLGAALNTEWLHFAFNSWLLLAIVALVIRYRECRWLLVAASFAIWHEAEHLFIIWTYLQTGVSGTPGLLSRGGAIAGGLPLSRPDLHLIYNLIETAPLLCGLVAELRRFSVSTGPIRTA